MFKHGSTHVFVCGATHSGRRALEVDFESTDVPKIPQNEPPILRASIPLFSSKRALRPRGERMNAMGERTQKQLFLEGCEAVTSSGILVPCATLNDALSILHATRREPETLRRLPMRQLPFPRPKNSSSSSHGVLSRAENGRETTSARLQHVTPSAR